MNPTPYPRVHTTVFLLLLSIICLPSLGMAAEGPILTFPADGTLVAKDGSGNSAYGSCGNPGALRFVEGRRGQGVYVSERDTISLPLESFNPKEGTLSFWFRPDWSPNNYTPQIMFEIHADPAYRMMFRKGWTSPDTCYMLVGQTGDFAMAFGSHNLFTANTWRHYALRWSADLGKIQLVVDGDARGESGRTRMGRFKCDTAGPIKATLLLRGWSRGAYDEVKVFSRYLPLDDLVKEAGLTRVARYLQEQAPPPGGVSSDVAEHEVSYVDPASGKKVVVPVLSDEEGLKTNEYSISASTYNPARMPQLPVTPHTKWAKPLAGGRLRVLFILPTGFYNQESALREVVELWQRLDMECEVTDRPDPAVLNKDYDVIVFSYQGWSPGGEGRHYGHRGWIDLNPSLRSWIVERVKSGQSGLVSLYPIPQREDDALRSLFDPKLKATSDPLLRGFPTDAMHRVDFTSEKKYEKVYELEDSWFLTPTELADKAVEAYGTGRRRVVKLNYQLAPWYNTMTLTPDTALNAAATDVHYDHWMALAARAVLFASGREPSATLAGDAWKVTIAGLSGPAKLSYRAEDAWGRCYTQGEMAVRASGEVVIHGVPLPPRCFVDFTLRNVKGEVLNWYSASTPPPSEARITGVVLDKDTYAKGETIQGRATIALHTAGTYQLMVYLDDHESRRLIRIVAPVEGSAEATREVPFSLTVPTSSDSLLMRVEAVLMKGNAILDTRSADCSVPDKQFAGFYTGMYGGAVNRFFNRTTRKWFRDDFGLDFGGRQGPHTFANLAKENLHSFEYTTHLGYPSDEKSFSAWMEDWDQFFPKNLWCDPEQTRRFRPIFYSLGEEHFMLMGSSGNPKANELFRDYIKGKYGDLQKLNAVWGTKYSSWDEVKMLTPDIVDMLKIKFDVPRFENRRFMEKLFADKHAYLANYFRKLDPDAKVGIHIGWDLWMGRGYDYWLLSRGMEAMMGYGGVQNQYIRSFFEKPYGCWFHYALGSAEDARWYPWYMLMSGMHGYGWYTIIPEVWGATTSDMHLSSDFQASKDEFKDAGDLGDLLVRTRYTDDQIAVHYSQDSFQAGVPDMSWIHTSFTNLLFDGGVPFRFVSYEQVAKGELLAKRFPVFLMPHSISLSPEEVKAIREYVTAGGVLWADVIPGEYDNFGRKLPESQLKDLFAGLSEVTLANGAKAKTGAFGKGSVILADIGNYSYDRNVGDHLRAQSLLDEVVRVAKIQRAAILTNQSDSNRPNGVWTAGYRSGDQQYVVATKDWQLADRSPAKVQIRFNRKGHVYEMRSGRYLGISDSIKDELPITSARAYASLPYRVKSIAATPAGQPTRGRDLVLNVRLVTDGSVAKDDLHLLRVTVTAPDGKEVTALRRKVLLSGSSGEVRLPIAYDDLPGRWLVHLRDVATGMRTDVAYAMK